MISAFFSALSAVATLVDHIQSLWNNLPMIKAKQAQMSQDELDAHRALIQQAIMGTPQQKQDALAQLRDLTAEG